MFHNIIMKHNKGLRKAAIIAFWILIWYALALLVDNAILLVTPWAVLLRLGELLLEPTFWQNIVMSLMRIGIGFLLGFVAALILAGISIRFAVVDEVLQPLMSLMKTVPVASFVVLFLIWWGSSALAVAISFLVVLPNIYINTLEGLKAADKQLLEMTKVFRVSSFNRFFFIYRPTLRPFLVSAMQLALGMCWKSGVAAEVIGTPSYSIGGELYLSKIYLDTAGVLAWTAVVIFLSLCFENLILGLTERFFMWMPSATWGLPRWRTVAERRMVTLTDKASCENDEMRLSLKGVSKAYGEQVVLTDVSTVYEGGTVYYLSSPSGSGKTTLLRLLCGLEQPDSGKIEGAKRFSMVFQEDRLCEEYNAIQNVALVIGEEEKAAGALRILLEEEALSKPCNQLSGGMKRRVALVRAMEAETDVVLLDEPFTGMDAETKQAAELYIRERQKGRIVIIATHI